MSKRQLLSPKSQAGQAIVLVAFMIIVLFGAVGLAVDGGIAYYYNAGAERAAAAAALSGVIFMPKQYLASDSIPAGAGNDATDRAVAAAKRNGFTVGVNNVTVTVSRYTDPVSGLLQNESLQVTVSRQVPTFFMQLFGIANITVSRTAVAQYLKPLKLGEPCLFPPAGPGDCHTGSTVSQLGNGGYYFLRTEGWDTDRSQGDAYTPNTNKAGCGGCPSTDVHSISSSQGTDVADPSFQTNGGYNYILTVPAGFTAQIQVYNAAFAPDGNAGGKNFCENWLTGQPGHACSGGGNYYMHEDDTSTYGTTNLSSAMRYTILSAPSVFIRSSDTIMSQMTVSPVDASNWQSNAAAGTDTGGTAPYYKDVNNANKKITQVYGTAAQCAPLAAGCPIVMSAYHAWMNVGGYVPSNQCYPTVICTAGYEAESSIIKYAAGRGPIGALPEGTYRLRIDTLNADGTLNPGLTQAHKGLAVRVMDGGNAAATCGNAASPCSLSALDDLSFFTPIATPAGGTFRIPVFSVPAIYAGLTIGIDIFDPGDINANGGSAYLGFVDPTTCALFTEPAGGSQAVVYNLGKQRSNLGTGAQTTVGTFSNPNPVELLVNNAGTQPFGGVWVHYEIPIPSTYTPNPAGTPCDPTGQGYWNLQYRTTANVSATDTLTITLNLRGNPAHILKS